MVLASTVPYHEREWCPVCKCYQQLEVLLPMAIAHKSKQLLCVPHHAGNELGALCEGSARKILEGLHRKSRRPIS